jgi:hypothetical protein
MSDAVFVSNLISSVVAFTLLTMLFMFVSWVFKLLKWGPIFLSSKRKDKADLGGQD